MLQILTINLRAGGGGNGHGNTQMCVSIEDFKLLCEKTGKKNTSIKLFWAPNCSSLRVSFCKHVWSWPWAAKSQTKLHSVWNRISPLEMSSHGFYIFLFVSNREKKENEYTQIIYMGIGLETIPTQVTEDSKHHQVTSWKITFPILHYRFSWFKGCQLRGKPTQDPFPSWMPGQLTRKSSVPKLMVGTN